MRISRVAIVLAVAALVGPQLLEAQVIIGVVMDAASGQRLADASVVLMDEDGKIVAGRLSEPDGTYSIPCPGPGKYTLRSGGPGYNPWDSPLIEVGEGETIELPVRLIKEGSGTGLEAFERRDKIGHARVDGERRREDAPQLVWVGVDVDQSLVGLWRLDRRVGAGRHIAEARPQR